MNVTFSGIMVVSLDRYKEEDPDKATKDPITELGVNKAPPLYYLL